MMDEENDKLLWPNWVWSHTFERTMDRLLFQMRDEILLQKPNVKGRIEDKLINPEKTSI